MTRELGLTYLTPDGTLVVVVAELGDHMVSVLVLQDNPKFTKPMPSGSVFPVLAGTVYWNESKLFSSDEEQGKVSS